MVAPILQGETLTSVQEPTFGVLAPPDGSKETAQRADFRTDIFEINIDAKGQRFAWSRAAHCPCVPVNDQTQQADPNCSLCSATGLLYFGPSERQNLSTEGLTDVQKLVVGHYDCFVMRGLMLSVGKSDRPWDKLGPWRVGTAIVTVRAQNQLGYMDRLINLDGTIPFSEILVVPKDNTAPLKSRYLITGGVYLCRSTEHRFRAGRDFFVKAGRITFLQGRGPKPGTRLTLHYITFPTWLVNDVPHATRLTNIAYKTNTPISPEGNIYAMPIQAALRLEFLPPIESAR